MMNTSYNTMSIEDVINTLDTQYRLSPLLKLRGHIAYRAAKLAGQYLLSTMRRVHENTSEHGAQHLDTINAVDALNNSDDFEKEQIEAGGMSTSPSMLSSLRELVEYANKLNYDMQDIVDESGTKRLRAGFKVRGVYFNRSEQVDSWYNSVGLLAEPEDIFASETYEQYCAGIDNPEWCLTREEWMIANTPDDNIWKTKAHELVALILELGDEERRFDEMSERAQIAAIENMRGKIGRCIESAVKSVRYNNQLDRAGKLAEASKLKGLINGWDREFCKMLDSSRYANFTEFMYNYMPQREGVSHAPVGRRIVAKSEQLRPVGRLSEIASRQANGEEVSAEERAAERAAQRAAVEAAKQAERDRLDEQRAKKKLGLSDLADILEMESDDLDA